MGNCFSVSLSLASTITRCCDCVARRAAYVHDLGDNVRALQNATSELSAQKNFVMNKVRIDSQEGLEMEPLPQVEDWRKKVEDLIHDVDELDDAASQEIQKLCLGGYFSTHYRTAYKLGKRVVKKREEVDDLKRKGDFQEVVYRVPPKPVLERNVEPTVGMEKLLDEAWSYIMVEQVDTLGLYGMGGVGKTTLLEQLNNRFHETQNDFGVVIFVTVSKHFRISKVQEDIWTGLGFSIGQWNDKSKEERAQDIFAVLNRKRFVLLLDDIWKPIDLVREIGVPAKRNGSKVVFTTRSEDLCGQLGAKGIKVYPLPWPKAWELFQEKMGADVLNIIKVNPDIHSLAEEAAKECDGLPIALITIARAMSRRKSLQEWNNAVKDLRKSASNLQGMKDKVLPLLKFSYDCLFRDGIQNKRQQCFLYCSLFPEDYPIPKRDLIDYWVGENFCNHDEGYDVVGDLVRASLLEEGEEDGTEYVKMHDVIRDMALWIACEVEKVTENYLVQASRELKEAREVKDWEGKRRISLMSNSIEYLEEVPKCSGLSTLFLNDNPLQGFSSGFFQSMKTLTTLNLSNTFIYNLPPEISELESLQYLNLSGTDISELPLELKKLQKLTYLNLEQNVKLCMIPMNLISSFKLLQVLRMHECGGSTDEISNDSILANNVLVVELKCLEKLNVLTISLKGSSMVQSFIERPMFESCIQVLALERFEYGSKSLNISWLADIKQLEELTIKHNSDLEELIIDPMVEVPVNPHNSTIPRHRNFNNLVNVGIKNCHGLLDLTWLVLLPNLRMLRIFRCEQIKEIVSGEKLSKILEGDGDLNLFEKLESIVLWGLLELKSIFPYSLRFPCLKRIQVANCSKLKKLPLNSNSAKEHKVSIVGQRDWWEKLEWEDDATKTAFSSSFNMW